MSTIPGVIPVFPLYVEWLTSAIDALPRTAFDERAALGTIRFAMQNVIAKEISKEPA